MPPSLVGLLFLFGYFNSCSQGGLYQKFSLRRRILNFLKIFPNSEMIYWLQPFSYEREEHLGHFQNPENDFWQGWNRYPTFVIHTSSLTRNIIYVRYFMMAGQEGRWTNYTRYLQLFKCNV